ncbi:MAG: glycosyltransferase [Lachnospiraceae bacterium]|jgi:glycosyltransferase involved in cell wall biosynthesis|nr:glycosyltransferase [Lachnospiraceae bacterium]
MENHKLISVIMSTYNEKEEWLHLSIKSILNQTWSELEFIIVNDNPDNKALKEVLDEYMRKDNRITVIQNEKNLGLAASMNIAWKRAKGKYVARMDADDISVLTRLEKEVEYLERNSLDLLASNKINISEKGEHTGGYQKIPQGRRAEQLLPYVNIINHPSVLMKRDLFETTGGYRELVPAEDYDLWLRMLTLEYKIGVLDEPLIYYRLRNNGISMSNNYKQFLLVNYVKGLYRERRKNKGTDSFSEENLESYLRKRFKETNRIRYDSARQCFYKGKCMWKKRKFAGGMIMLKAMISNYNCALEKISYFHYKIRKYCLLKREKNETER